MLRLPTQETSGSDFFSFGADEGRIKFYFVSSSPVFIWTATVNSVCLTWQSCGEVLS